MQLHLQAIATLFSLVNPLICALIFGGVIRGFSRAEAMRSATLAMLIVGGVLTVAAFAGAEILKIFGISLDAFSVAGGTVLIFIGFSMLTGSSAPSTPGPKDASPEGAPDLGRLVLFAASPGTITGVITIVAAHRSEAAPVAALTAIAAVVGVTWLLLLFTAMKSRSGERARPGLLHEMTSRYMGLIIIAMGIQFMLTGYKAFMAA